MSNNITFKSHSQTGIDVTASRRGKLFLIIGYFKGAQASNCKLTVLFYFVLVITDTKEIDAWELNL